MQSMDSSYHLEGSRSMPADDKLEKSGATDHQTVPLCAPQLDRVRLSWIARIRALKNPEHKFWG